MIKKYLSLLVLTSILVIFLPSISQSSQHVIKNNSVCTKKNKIVEYVNKQYKCTLVNKKLIWKAKPVGIPTELPTPTPTFTIVSIPNPIPAPSPNKDYEDLNWQSCTTLNERIKNLVGEFECQVFDSILRWTKNNPGPSPKPVPTPTSIPTDKPTPDPIPISKPRNTGQLASDAFVKWASKNESIKNNHFVIRNNDIPDDIFKAISLSEIKTANIFANFVSRATYGYYGGEDKNWFFTHNKLVPSGDTSNICNAHPDGVGACTNLINDMFYRIPNDNFQISYGISALGAHEYFHIVQAEVAGLNPFINRSMPRWFEEGSAEFIGYSVLSIISNEDYDNIVKDKKVFKDLFSDPYISGRMLVEFIIKEYGFEAFFKIYSDYKSNNNFEEVFKNNIGISSNDVLNKFRIGL